jgi:proteasome lid subunit RPN8/RPN11
VLVLGPVVGDIHSHPVGYADSFSDADLDMDSLIDFDFICVYPADPEYTRIVCLNTVGNKKFHFTKFEEDEEVII